MYSTPPRVQTQRVQHSTQGSDIRSYSSDLLYLQFWHALFFVQSFYRLSFGRDELFKNMFYRFNLCPTVLTWCPSVLTWFPLAPFELEFLQSGAVSLPFCFSIHPPVSPQSCSSVCLSFPHKFQLCISVCLSFPHIQTPVVFFCLSLFPPSTTQTPMKLQRK